MPSAAHAQVVALLRSLPRPVASAENVQAIRAALDAIPTRAPRGVASHQTRAPDRPAEWLVHEDSDPDVRLLYLHGGGFVAGSLHTHRALAGRIARAGRAAVLLVDYRLAPEHRYPAALEDALAALRHVRDHGPLGPGRARRLFVAGDSAGGGLALATAVALRDAGERWLDGVVTLSAWTDLSASGASIRAAAARDPMLDPELLPVAARLYLGGVSPSTPLASPLFADLVDLPPLLMQVGEHEILHDDTIRLMAKARRAGVDVETDIALDMFHVYQLFSMPESREAIGRIGAWLRRRAA
ncbi:MAG: alpha/beta hydrolase [Myxococcales bacterium]|nr:alpha/beta hydrolase [Myxococcales bacterium]